MQRVFFQQYSSNDFQSIIRPASILFFDMDGTLIETNELNNFAYREAFKKVMGHEMPNLKTSRITRKNLLDIPGISKSDIDKIVAEKGLIYSNNLNLASPIPYTVDILKNYSGQHPTYLVTRAKQDRAIETIAHFGLLDSFTGILSSPSGNKYQNAITASGADPKDIIVLENEDFEIDGGIEAGILSNNIIKVTYGILFDSTE